MKILKHGNVEQRKFVCKKCGCEFVAGTSDITWHQCEYNKDAVECPCGRLVAWEKGDPYEKPMQDDTARLSKLIADCPISLTALGVSASQTLRFADYLTENGVTFREGLVYETGRITR